MPFAWIAGRRGAGIQRKATTALALSPLRAAGFTISAPISSPSPSTRHPNLWGANAAATAYADRLPPEKCGSSQPLTLVERRILLRGVFAAQRCSARCRASLGKSTC